MKYIRKNGIKDPGSAITHGTALILAVVGTLPLLLKAAREPDHLHVVWTLPPGDDDFATRWMLIKAQFSRRIENGERLSASRRKHHERGIWQRRYWEHLIRDERDLQNHIDYIHFNPVKHGWAQRPGEWPHSSFHRFVLDGVLPADWSGSTEPRR